MQNTVKFTINANSVLYVGTLLVFMKDSSNAVVYSGALSTWTSTWAATKFPLSMTVTPSTSYQVYTQTGITDASNIIVNLQAAAGVTVSLSTGWHNRIYWCNHRSD
jgi:hypothetical protein